MRRLLVTALAALVIPEAAHAVVCADRTPAAISTVAPAALKCQEKIASEGAKFLKAKMKALAGCRANKKVATGDCPDGEGHREDREGGGEGGGEHRRSSAATTRRRPASRPPTRA